MENAKFAILDMSLRILEALTSTGMALQQPICSRSYKLRPMPRICLTEESLEGEEKGTLQGFQRLQKGHYSKARPQRICCPRMHFEALENNLGNLLFKAKPGSFSGGLRPLFGGRIPAVNSRPDSAANNNEYSGPESGRLLAAGIRPPK